VTRLGTIGITIVCTSDDNGLFCAQCKVASPNASITKRNEWCVARIIVTIISSYADITAI
jgi:hypothetical protein